VLELSRDELLSRLWRLDEDAELTFEPDNRYHLVIVGGGALILHQYIPRATSDVDAISVSPQLLTLLEKYNINCRLTLPTDKSGGSVKKFMRGVSDHARTNA